jgi:chromosome partitioning protein
MTAVYLAANLRQSGSTVLVDGDRNRSATGWASRGNLPFKVVDERQAVRYAREFEHIVIDSEARPNRKDLETLADGCALLVTPTSPDALASMPCCSWLIRLRRSKRTATGSSSR